MASTIKSPLNKEPNRPMYKSGRISLPIYTEDELKPYLSNYIQTRRFIMLCKFPSDPYTFVYKPCTTMKELEMMIAAGNCAVTARAVVTSVIDGRVEYNGILMDYGVPLTKQYLRSLSWKDKRTVILEILDLVYGSSGLHSISPEPIIHGDIKPANILLCGTNKKPRFTDFEASKFVNSKDDNYECESTLNYLSKKRVGVEFSKKYPLRKQDDYYALALSLWEICVGQEPFEELEGDYDDIEAAILEGRQPDLSKISQIDKDIQDTIKSLLQSGGNW
jgi:hypothetical protein